MKPRRRWVSSCGQPLRFERIGTVAENDRTEVTWAASRRGEFIGTLSCPEHITTGESDVRCWAVA